MTDKKITIITIVSMMVSLLLITIGLSFAYFSANITGTETSTTIQASGGVMNIDYDGGENINTPNIFPSNEPFATKNFTLTGKSTTSDNMNYHIILVIEENTFTNNALQYKLTSTNTDGNGTIAPSIIQSGIATGAQEIYLGDGTFESPANNKEHLYTLELYFPDTIEDQNDDMNKTFKAYINIREGHYIFPGYNQEKGVNHPVLFTGMNPVVWDGEDFVETTEDDPAWYDYDNKIWANAKSQDGSYWVWIPRYAYKITSGYHSSTTGTIDLKFLKGRTNEPVDETVIETEGYDPNGKNTSTHHFLHPAFQFNGDELGFWIAKYQPNNSDGTPKIEPNATIWTDITVSNAFNVSLEMKNKTETYGWLPEEVDTHMLTNHEWGAVAYLSKSKYGAHEEEVWINNSNSAITGCAGNSVSASSTSGCQNEYYTENGQKASTTHNIYGVYDMSGGALEYVMGNLNNTVASSGFGSSSVIAQIDNKYINRYTANNGLIYGDAVYETSSGSTGSTGWNSDYSSFITASYPWFGRGGAWDNGTDAGVFAFSDNGGNVDSSRSFRPALWPL